MGVLILYVIDATETTKPFCIICHPKTGSQSTIKALREQLGARTVHGQHYFDESECRSIREEGGIVVCTVRNPWDLTVSWYFYSEYDKRYNGKWPDKKPFLDWLPNWLKNGNGWVERGFYAVDHCNRIIRFEHNLEKQLNHCLEDCSLPPVKLDVIGKTEHKHYSRYYDIPSAIAVGRFYADEINEWGYKFETSEST
jgi:hypothetical protein